MSFDRARESHGYIHTNKRSKVDSKGEAATRHRDISLGRWDNLEGWEGERGREGDTRGKTHGSICICIADSLCYKAKTNTPL